MFSKRFDQLEARGPAVWVRSSAMAFVLQVSSDGLRLVQRVTAQYIPKPTGFPSETKDRWGASPHRPPRLQASITCVKMKEDGASMAGVG